MRTTRLPVLCLLAASLPLWAAEGPRGPARPEVAALEARVGTPLPGSRQEALALPDKESAVRFIAGEDGVSFGLLKFRSEGAAAVRLRLSDVSLPEGASLYVYGLDADGRSHSFAGPFTGAGPGEGGEFMTPAVRGDTIVVELQVAGEPPVDLPFTAAALERADAPDEERPLAAAVAKPPVEVRSSLYRGRALTHEVIDGQAVFEGDILLGRADELPAADPKSTDREGVALSSILMRWPGGVIPYVLDDSLPPPSRDRIEDAVSHWNDRLQGVIRLVRRRSEAAHLNFEHGSGCRSFVGMMLYGQRVELSPSCSTGNIIHEIGHAVGLLHEHTREDRDRHIRVNYENINPTSIYNFAQSNSVASDLGPYDYGSIMHYPATGFSRNGQPTIETIPAGIPIGQRGGLSAGDIAAVRSLYGAATSASVQVTQETVTISSNPPGLMVRVDGVEVSTPRTFQWAVGSQHHLEARDLGDGSPTRHLFAYWSDGQPASRLFTMPARDVSLTASFSAQHLVRVQSQGLGTVSVAPLSTTGYYPARSTVRLDAEATTDTCFEGWTGLPVGTAADVDVLVDRPLDLTARFGTGAVTVLSSRFPIGAAGGIGSIWIGSSGSCTWRSRSAASWVNILQGHTGVGNGYLVVLVQPNLSEFPRAGTLTISGRGVQVRQEGRDDEK